MFIDEPAPFINAFIEELDKSLREIEPEAGLTTLQKKWLAFCVLAILVTNSVCWAKFERASLGSYSLAALSWMFRKAPIRWELILYASVKVIVWRYGISQGVLVVDDTEKKRAKTTTRIHRAHKLKDKKTGGYINGQSLIMLLLVTPVVTIPVGFGFHQTDPALSAWYKSEKKLKKEKVAKKDRPPKPEKNEAYPNKQEIALHLMIEFKTYHPQIKIKAVLADTLYGTEDFMDAVATLFDRTQVISQLRSNQLVQDRNQKTNLDKYFAKQPASTRTINVRGQQKVVTIAAARLYVYAHHQKRLVIALKYEGETEYRYLVASDLSWRVVDVLEVYALRWLVEVFFQDWKSYEGWGQLTKQPDEEGSSRSLILSLLLDHSLLFHPEQLARLENKLPAITVGSLQERIKAENLLQFIQGLLSEGNHEEKLKRLSQAIVKTFYLFPSKKHMVQQEVVCFKPDFGTFAHCLTQLSPSLRIKQESFSSLLCSTP
jgi:hypothetical protein